MKKIILGLLVFVTAFVSCTNQEEIEISYKTRMSVTASHLFDSFYKALSDDFAMKGVNGDWNINLRAFIYDHNGDLVKSVEEEYPTLTSEMNFDLDLVPGHYSIVSIADFTGTFDGQNYRFWNISNEQKLNDLCLTESETICNSPFETLGIVTSNFEIGNRAETISIDIKPVTGLLQVIIWDDDFSGIGKDGFSFYAPYIETLSIYAQDLKQVVKFDGITPKYDYGIQAVRYQIQTHSPRSQYLNHGSVEVLGYRALLPQEKRDFYWELKCITGAGQGLFLDGKDEQSSDLTMNALNIESGKQYAMDLVLDNLYLYVQDYNPDVDMFERLEGILDIINQDMIRKTLEERYDKYVGMNKNAIETYLEKKLLYVNESNNTSAYEGDGLIGYITAQFEDSSMQRAKRIVLTWNPLSSSLFELVTKVLGEFYTPLEKGSTENIKQFINSSSLDDATVGISWDIHNNCLYFDAIK